MNLAIATPNSSTYSETFIHMQMERLPCRLRIHGRPIASETIPGGPIAPLRCLRGVVDTLIEVGLRRMRREGAQRRELKRRLKRAGVQVLLANYGPTGVALLPVCLQVGIPLVVHFHGFDAHTEEIVTKFKDAYRELGRSAGAVIAVSKKMVQALESYGIPKSRIHLVRYGCDPARFQEKNGDPGNTIFFGVGRFVDKKAPYLTVLAFKKVHDQMPGAKLVLAGDGVLWETTRNLARGLGLGSVVEFPGILKPNQVAEYMCAATVFVQHSIVPQAGPSRGDSEGTPVAVLEAMLAGLPVVATRHAGIGEIIEHGHTGFLVEERDVDGMAEAMMKVARNPALAQSVGLAARQEILEKYTADNYIRSLERILSSVL